ncbi:MAG TPA: dodecin family protein [Methanofastidiosum sp.]|jgi:flavin-binding protein dodecin|nr:dodecin family protein [Methanofastidiosum sp.]HNU61625.1 dodecin family protein [Methanofastidiosum sp.]HOI77567.1 dodecin family protein [Methanofastidiosum sp.]
MSDVAKVIEVVGKSEISWEDAVAKAVFVASKTVHNIKGVEVEKLTGKVTDGKITKYKATVKLIFVVE